MNRLDSALKWLAAEFSATPDELRQAHMPGGDMLLTGLLSHGYALRKGDRLAVSPIGRRRLEDVEARVSVVEG